MWTHVFLREEWVIAIRHCLTRCAVVNVSAGQEKGTNASASERCHLGGFPPPFATEVSAASPPESHTDVLAALQQVQSSDRDRDGLAALRTSGKYMW